MVSEARSENPGKCPVLVDLIIVPVCQIVDMGRLLKQIRNHEVNHIRIATMVLPQVKNKSIGLGAGMSGVFISYRRDDGSGYAGRLFDILSVHLGRENPSG